MGHASASPPLLDAVNGVLSLTAAGRAILDGRSDRVATCGIDRWFGGVHLQGQAIDWRWNRDLNRIVMSRDVRGGARLGAVAPLEAAELRI